MKDNRAKPSSLTTITHVIEHATFRSTVGHDWPDSGSATLFSLRMAVVRCLPAFCSQVADEDSQAPSSDCGDRHVAATGIAHGKSEATRTWQWQSLLSHTISTFERR